MKNNNIFSNLLNLKNLIYMLLITTSFASLVSIAKFGKSLNSSSNSIIAYIGFDVESSIILEKIHPDMDPLSYDLTVKNTKNNKKSEVNFTYTISLIDIGNIPLDFELYRKENGIIVSDNLMNLGLSDEIEFTMDSQEDEHDYEIIVKWDRSIEGFKDHKYNAETSILKVLVDANQQD